MARSVGKIFADIWQDPDWVRLDVDDLPQGDAEPFEPGRSALVDIAALAYRDWRRWPVAPHFVYALLDGDRELFYIGRTGNLRERLTAHRSRRGFGPHRPRFVFFQAFPSMEQAAATEVALIRWFQPSGNCQHCTIPRKVAH